MYADSLSGYIAVTNVSSSTVTVPWFQILVDQLVGDEYVNESYNRGWKNITFSPDQTRYLTVVRKATARETNHTYRLRIASTGQDPKEDYDTRYIIHMYQPKKELTDESITILAIADQTYTGSAITPAVVVKDGEKDITDQCDIYYSNNIEIGVANVSVYAKSSSTAYTGRVRTTFKIVSGDTTGWKECEKSGVKSEKILRDGQILILRGEHVYTITGLEIRD